MKLSLKIKLIGGAVAGTIVLGYVLFREIMNGRMNKQHVKDMREGFVDATKENEKVIAAAVKVSGEQKEVIKKNLKVISEASMDEQFQIAKKLGLTK